MKKLVILILAALLMLSVFVACNQDEIVDSMFGHVVTFDANGGEGEMKSQRIAGENGGALTPNAFTKADYQFDSWNSKADGTGTGYGDGAVVVLDEDITLYAQWIHDEAIITFHANGGEGEMDIQSVKTKTPTVLFANTYERDNYIFDSWNTKADGTGTTYGDGALITVTADTTLYAQWWQPTVTFDANGGTGSMSQAVAYGIATPLDPIGTTITREGYHFTEWNTEKDGSGDFYYDEESITITDDLTLYAIWNADTYTVSFDANGGSEVKTTIEVTYGYEYGELPDTIKGGSDFSGWFTEDGTLVEEDTIVAIAKDHVLTAYWDAKTYKITYETDGGEIDPEQLVTEYTFGEGAKLPTIVTKEGDVFGGWYKTADFSGKPFTEITKTEAGDRKFYAKWLVVYLDENTTEWEDGYIYTLKEDEELTIANRIFVDGDVILILPDSAKLTAEKGISVSKGNRLVIVGEKEGTGELIANGEDYAAGIGGRFVSDTDTKKDAGTIIIAGGTVTAQGGKYSAGIGGGASGEGGTVKIIGGTVTATAGADTTEAIGKGDKGEVSGTLEIGTGMGLFGGEDAENIEFLSGPTTEVYEGPLTPYMEAKATTYVTVTFDANGGTGTMAAQVIPSEFDVKLNENKFQHETLSFAGWAETAEGDVKYADKAEINIKADTTLYAKWVDVIYLKASDTTIGGGKKYTISDNLTLDNNLVVSGSATIILPDEKTLTAPKGITVNEGNSLTIIVPEGAKGTGTLDADGSDGNAAIGSVFESNAGTIIINGGTIKADGGMYGAGIGGGFKGTVTEITINGGIVIATGGAQGSGIGGGQYGDGGIITITNGTITASGGANAAGIGGGRGASGGTISISGGTVTATGIGGGSGIGKGNNGDSEGTLTLDDDVFVKVSDDGTTWSDYEVDVRHAYMKTVVPTVITDKTTEWTDGGVYTLDDKDVVIEERVDVTGDVRLVIPKGRTLTTCGGIDVSEGDVLTIDGEGTVISTGGNGQAGIGGDSGEKGGTVIVKGGTVITTGGTGATGIGKGAGGASDGPLTIGEGEELFGGEDKDHSVFLSGPTESYDDPRPVYMVVRPVIEVTVTFNANGGTGEMAAQTIHAEVPTALNKNTFKLTDMAFAGWATSSTGEKVYSNGEKVTISSDVTLYALWEEQKYQYITAETTVLTAGSWTIEDNVENTNRITVEAGAEVTIDLPDKMTLTITGGIHLPEGTEMVIQGEGTGKLIADASANECAWKAGIGGDEGENAGKLTVESGTIEVKGGSSAAGIGGGKKNQGAGGNGGTVIIKGGSVTSTGGKDGAGIGGGSEGSNGEVTISGGEVTAKGGVSAAGIGGGYKGNGGKTTISGGTVNSTGGNDGAGIGGGYSGNGVEILISGGTVTSTGGTGAAGIGGGYSGAGGTITIESGTVTATGKAKSSDYGAGIGGGGNDGASGTITIGKKDVTAPIVTATAGGADTHGIGKGSGTGTENPITLNGIGVEVSADNENWEDLNAEQNNRNKFMRTYVGVTISYEANGGSGEMASQTVHAGVSVTLAANTFTAPESSVFTGWNTKADGSGDKYANQASVKPTEDLKLYAQWLTLEPIPESGVLAGGKSYLVSGTVNYTDRVTIDGTSPVTIYLKASSTLNAYKGITVDGGQTLIIDGENDTDAVLIATAQQGDYGFHPGAGIGTGFGTTAPTTCGTIIINGGKITAEGYDNSAGIGGSLYSSGENTGVIEINGGDVTAIGWEEGAGIGGGRNEDGGVITITGGKVTAISKRDDASGSGAGIGGGRAANGGTITITGGTVTATGGNMGGAGIGGGYTSNEGEHDGGNIAISGGIVYANGGHGAAAIGGGFAGLGGSITVSGGTVYAFGGDTYGNFEGGAGIGGGAYGGSGTIAIKKDGDVAPLIYAVGGKHGKMAEAEGIGKGGANGSSSPIALDGVNIFKSYDKGETWISSDGSIGDRALYMKTENATPPTT